jgi:hypothetical protein
LHVHFATPLIERTLSMKKRGSTALFSFRAPAGNAAERP